MMTISCFVALCASALGSEADLTAGRRDLELARSYKVFVVDGQAYPFNAQDANGQKLALAPSYAELVTQYTMPVPTDPQNPKRTPQRLFKDALAAYRRALRDVPTSTRAQAGLRDAVAELIEGQTLIGNDALVNALRARFPRVNAAGQPQDAWEPHGLFELTSRRFEESLDDLSEVLTEFPGLLREKGDVSPVELVENADGVLVPGELYRAVGALERKARARVGRGKKVFNESGAGARSQADVEKNRDTAAAHLRAAGHEAYLGLAVLGALHSDPASYSRNLTSDVRAQLAVAETVFQSIRSGESPRGYVADFIPSKEIAEVYADAVNAVVDANNKENTARAAARVYDGSLEKMRIELSAQRQEYRKPLERLSGLKINDNGSVQRGTTALQFNIGQPEGRAAFLDYLRRNIMLNVRKLYEELIAGGRASAAQIDLEAMPVLAAGEDITPIGEIGVQLLELKDANLGVAEAIAFVRSYPAKIQVEEQRVGRIATARYRNRDQRLALHIAVGVANMVITSFEVGFLPSLKTTINPGAIVAELNKAKLEDLEIDLAIDIENANSEAVIKNLLIDQQRAVIALRRAENRLVQARSVLDNLLAATQGLLEDWGRARTEAGEIFFKYPTFRIDRDHAVATAEDSFDRAVESCYFAAKALQYEWVEPFSNPIKNHSGGNDVALPVGYERFTRIESLFGVRDTVELADFLKALYQWHLKLSTNGLRGNPQGNERQFTGLLSLREDILGFDDELKSDAQSPEEIKNANSALFRQWVDLHLVPNRQTPALLDLLFEFSTEIDSERFFATDQWNQKILGMGISLRGGPFGATRPRIKVTQGGTSSIRQFPTNKQVIERLSLQGLGPIGVRDAQENPAAQRTFDEIEVRLNADADAFRSNPGGTMSAGLVGLSIASDRWTFHFDRSKPENRTFPIERITDIQLIIEYSFDHPPTGLGSTLLSQQSVLVSIRREMPLP